MNRILTWIHIGLYLVVIVETLAICVLYHRNTELMKLVTQGGHSASSLIGLPCPKFTVQDLRSEQILRSVDIFTKRTHLLIISSSCFNCEKLIDELRNHQELLDTVAYLNFIIYCQGSRRGCSRMLETLDQQILTMVAHEEDLTEIFSAQNPPVLVEIEASGRIVKFAYPFSSDDLLTSINETADRQPNSTV